MFFFTRIYTPNFSSTPYEKLIEEQLLNKFFDKATPHQYKTVLELQKHAANIASSIYQLRSDSIDLNDVNLLENEIAAAISLLLASIEFDEKIKNRHIPPFNKKPLENSFLKLENQLKDNTFAKVQSGVYLVTNSILLIAGLAGFIFAISILAAPVSIGIGFLGLGLALLSAAVFMLAAYSLYVDGRFLFNKQINEIKTGIDFMNSFVDLMKNEPPGKESGAIQKPEELGDSAPAPAM